MRPDDDLIEKQKAYDSLQRLANTERTIAAARELLRRLLEAENISDIEADYIASRLGRVALNERRLESCKAHYISIIEEKQDD